MVRTTGPKRLKTAPPPPVQQHELWFKFPRIKAFSINISDIPFESTLGSLHELIEEQALNIAYAIPQKNCYGFSLTKPGTTGEDIKERKFYHAYTEIGSVLNKVSATNPLRLEDVFTVLLRGAHPKTYQSVHLSIPYGAVQDYNKFTDNSEVEKVLSDCFCVDFPLYGLQVVTPTYRGFEDIFERFDCKLTCNPCRLIKETAPAFDSSALTQYVSAAKFLSKTQFVSDLKSYLFSETTNETLDARGNALNRCLQTFSSLVLPSMTGKTQVGLSLGSGAFYMNFRSESQTIYKAFDHISTALIHCAKLDMKQFRSKDYLEGDNSTPSNDFITLTMIDRKFDMKGRKSYLCGFINALIDHCNSHIIGSCEVEEWIESLVNERFSEVPALNTSFLFNKLRKGYSQKVLFILDEFPSFGKRNWKVAVFVRNFLRHMNIACLLMGTSTHINNLIGKASGSGSSSKGFDPWSDMLFRLPKTDVNYITSNYNIGNYFARCGCSLSLDDCQAIVKDAIETSMNHFSRVWFQKLNMKEEWGRRMIRFFKVLVDQIKTSRPGISIFIAQQGPLISC